MRCIFGEESVRGDDSASVTEADLPCGSHRSTVVTAEVEVEPADYHWKGRVSAHRDKKQRCVFEMWPRVHGQQNGEASDGHSDWNQREQEAMLELIRKESDDKSKDEGTCPWRDAVQLGTDLRITVCFNDAGCEKSVSVGGDDESEIHESAEDEFVVFEAFEDIFGGDAALACGATLILFKTSFDVSTFIFFEPTISSVSITFISRWQGLGSCCLPFRLFRKVWYHEVECE